MTRGHFIAAALGAVAATVLAGGVAWAAIPGPTGLIQGCYDAGGNVKVVETLPCPRGYTPFSWSQQGIQGLKGDAGPQGPKGDKGDAGPAGQSFSGTVTSPNGEYSISVTDAGITIAHGATNAITLVGNDLSVRTGNIDMRSEFATLLRAGTTAGVDAGANLTLDTAGSGFLHADGNIDVQSGQATLLSTGTTATVNSTGDLTLRTSKKGLVHADERLDLQGSVVNIN
jgi:hypothetical protein